MDSITFNKIVEDQVNKCLATLISKSDEYSTVNDKLHNFNVGAELINATPRQALAGMMLKHTISIYDMLYSKEKFPMSLWEEKIGDHINYLLLLKAIVTDEGEQ